MRTPSSIDDDREPGDDSDQLIGKAHPQRDDDADVGEDREHRVAHRVNPLPLREEEEEELSEADIMEELDDDDLDAKRA
jgi:hypothetical protein